MKTMSYTAVRNKFKAAMEQVCDDHAPIIITRQNQRPVVIISLDDYNSIEETMYLLRSPKNAARLMESMADIEDKKYDEHDLKAA